MLACKQVLDPPEVGFDAVTIEAASQKTRRYKLLLDSIESCFSLKTSTPLKRHFSWASFCKEACIVMASKIIDNDSGYISNHQESNSADVYNENELGSTVKEKFVYMNEDALLEKPTGSDVSRIEDSVSCEEERFIGLHDSVNEESGISNKANESPVILNISPIVITKEKFELLAPATDSTTTETTNVVLSPQKLDLVAESCDNDSNAENNFNYLNVQSRAATLLSLSIAEKSKDEPVEKVEKQTYENVQLFNITQTPEKACKNPVDANMSPDIFSDDDLDISQCSQVPKVEFKERYILKQDRKLHRRAKEMLIGVPPPISLQHVNLTVSQILEKYEQNEHLLLTKEDVEGRARKRDESMKNCDITFLTTAKGFESVHKLFPAVLEERYHGLHYNRSKLSEEIEQLAMKYASKYIGCETHSSCTVFHSNFPSSPSKNSSKLRWAVKSPGKRLSHLARRRITFSSANLQAQTRQVVVDPRRLKLLARKKSPLKKSPRKTPKKSPAKRIKTPTSSAKKKLSMQLRLMAQQMPTTSKVTATKRALFQSPEKIATVTAATSKVSHPNPIANASVSPFKRRTNLKCVLFASPTKNSPSKNGNKRKRTDSDAIHPSKLPRALSLQETSESNLISKVTLVRVKSEVLSRSLPQKTELSETHKKKLFWAIYEALRGQKVPTNHPQYKQYAATLFRVTKKFLPDLSVNAPRPEGGTSERMLKIARQHVCAVLQGKSVDEIIQEYEQKRLRNVKPSGYVTIEEAKKMDVSKAKENVLKDRANQISLMVSKPEVKKFDRIDKVRKVINFDGDNGVR